MHICNRFGIVGKKSRKEFAMVKFMKKVTKLALKSAAICTGIAAGAALLHKYVKIQSNCGGCGPKEDDFDEDKEEEASTATDTAAEQNTEAAEDSDEISSDEATDSSSRRYINIHVTGQNSDVDINIDKGQLFDDAAKLVADAAQLTKNLRPGSHNTEEKEDENTEKEDTQSEQTEDTHFNFKHMDANNDIADLDIEDLGVDIDEDLSEGISDLYAMDGVDEAAMEEDKVDTETKTSENVSSEKTTTDHNTVSKDEHKTEEVKEEAPVNSSIHL